MKISNLQELNEKWWYRFIKVVFIASVLLFLAFVLLIIFVVNAGDLSGIITWSVGALIVVLTLAHLLRKLFYYIVLGTFNPQD